MGCAMAGVIAMISSEMSVVLLALITLERLHVIFSVNKVVKWRRKAVIIMCAVAWLAVSALALVPFSPLNYFGNNFYRWSAVCLPLHLSGIKYQGWEYSVAIFLGFNSASLILVCAGYLAILIIYKKKLASLSNSETTITTAEYDITHRTACVVMTDVCCWLPIIIMQICTLSGNSLLLYVLLG